MALRLTERPSTPDNQAQNEGTSLADGQSLEEAAAKSQHSRDEGLKDILHKAVCGAVVVASVAISLMGVIWVIHTISPWGWLNSGQLETIKNTLFSGAVGGMVANHLNKVNS